MSKLSKRLENLEVASKPVKGCVVLYADLDQEGIYWDQPPGDQAGYRKRRKYSEADKRRLEKDIGEDVLVIRPGVKVWE